MTTPEKSRLAPVCLICGDVALLRQETLDKLRQQAKKAGFYGRSRYQVETGFDWSTFFSSLANFDLFSEKQVIELFYPSAKFDAKVTTQLLTYLESPANNQQLIIITDKLTASQQKTRWYQAIKQRGTIYQLATVNKKALPGWINERARKAGLRLSRESVLLLAELTEGHLLASQQALDKLALLYGKQPIEPQKILAVISDNAQFNVFDLANQLLAGDLNAALRILQGLLAHQTEATLILWAICREIRTVSSLLHQQQQGASLNYLLEKQWASRRALLQQAVTRLSIRQLQSLLSLAAHTDQVIKGAQEGSLQEMLETLIIQFCGKTLCHD